MTSPVQLLVVSPDSAVLQIAQRCAQTLGYDPLLARDVRQAQRLIARARIDLICLDSLVPCDEAEQFWHTATTGGRCDDLPVLFVGPPRSKLVPSTLPAFYRRDRDGFVTKPLNGEALAREVARLLAARPRRNKDAELVRAGPAVLDGQGLQFLFPGTGALRLTPTEFRLLRCLMQRAGQFVLADELLEEAWGYPRGTGGPEIVRAHVSNLRRKLRDAGLDPQMLRTLPYQGYGFIVSGER